MATTTAINERSGKWETVTVDGFGRVPAGYRTLTERERNKDRAKGLEEEIARLRGSGRVVEAEQQERTLADLRWR
jgi:hypothetical protein